MSKHVTFNDIIQYFEMDFIAARGPVYLRPATQELEDYKPIVVYPPKRPYLQELIRVLRETNTV